jgi:hypothetical protein
MDDAHTCAYGHDQELGRKAGEMGYAYEHVTDHLCPSHSRNWVHIGCGTESVDGYYQHRCTCGWTGVKFSTDCDPKGEESRQASREYWLHQADHCTCYYVLKEGGDESRGGNECGSHKEADTRISATYVAQTIKNCSACQLGFSTLEAEHTCLGADVVGLMFAESTGCCSHGDDRHHCIKGIGDDSESAQAKGQYRCQCGWESSRFDDLAGDVRASREMALHRAESCSCEYVDRHVWARANPV